MHICVSKLVIVGSNSGFLPGRRQAIILNNAGILLNGCLGTHFSEIKFEIKTFHRRTCLENGDQFVSVSMC